LVRITERDAMCMLSDRYLGERADVPVSVEGKTYHGCCANCATRLSQVAELRRAVDPVSGRAVDKGSAIIARDPQNKLLYFESEETLAAFSAR
jgi:YHS domain-containing protein